MHTPSPSCGKSHHPAMPTLNDVSVCLATFHEVVHHTLAGVSSTISLRLFATGWLVDHVLVETETGGSITSMSSTGFCTT